MENYDNNGMMQQQICSMKRGNVVATVQIRRGMSQVSQTKFCFGNCPALLWAIIRSIHCLAQIL